MVAICNLTARCHEILRTAPLRGRVQTVYEFDSWWIHGSQALRDCGELRTDNGDIMKLMVDKRFAGQVSYLREVVSLRFDNRDFIRLMVDTRFTGLMSYLREVVSLRGLTPGVAKRREFL